MKGSRHLLLFIAGVILFCPSLHAQKAYELASKGDLPQNLPHPSIAESRFLEPLINTYFNNPKRHERIKIKYLIDSARHSGFQFDWNGYIFNSQQTAAHLLKKYRQRFQQVKTADDFIEHVASRSSTTGREYYVLPGDGKAYFTGPLLRYELRRLEKFLEKD